MGITKFLYLLFFCAILFLFYTKESKIVYVKKVEKPLIEFENSVMYDISSKGVNQVIQSQNANIFKNLEQLMNATITIKSQKDITKVNTISADQIVKVKNDLYLNHNVVLQNDNKITLKTDELQYNTKSLIAVNNSKFSVVRNNDTLDGIGLYFDGKTNHIKASKTQFRIELKENNETI